MVHPAKLSLAGFGIVTGGVLLGAALSAFANPVPKPAPPPPWNPMLHPPIAAGPSQSYYEPLPEDLSPRNLPDSYPPAFATSELTEWPVDFASPAFEEWDLEPALASDEPDEGERTRFADLSASRPEARSYAAVEVVAQRAEAAVEDAQEAQASLNPPEDNSAQLVAEPASAPPEGQAKIISVAETG